MFVFDTFQHSSNIKSRTIADHITSSMPPSKSILIDAFAGVGGNTIAFALSGRFHQIFAIEKDPATLKCAKHNADVYGVKNKILWIEGDCFETMKKRFFDPKMKDKAVIFASPPWGGIDYNADQIFDLTTMPPYGLQTLWDAFTKVTKEVVLYLPRTSDLNQLAQLVGKEGEELKDEDKVQVTHYCMRGASKALCVYYGKFTG
jgi:trimethylguanosine synthase